MTDVSLDIGYGVVITVITGLESLAVRRMNTGFKVCLCVCPDKQFSNVMA